MEKLDVFDIPFVGLKNGIHQFDYPLDNSFFEGFDFREFQEAAFHVNIAFDKKERMLELHYSAKGHVRVSCDVTLEPFDLEMAPTWSQIIKFGNPEASTDEILILPEGTYKINVAQSIYEMIILAIPPKLEHPGLADGSLQSDILDKLKALEPKTSNVGGQNDPRWNKLKDLL